MKRILSCTPSVYDAVRLVQASSAAVSRLRPSARNGPAIEEIPSVEFIPVHRGMCVGGCSIESSGTSSHLSTDTIDT